MQEKDGGGKWANVTRKTARSHAGNVSSHEVPLFSLSLDVSVFVPLLLFLFLFLPSFLLILFSRQFRNARRFPGEK